MKRTEYVVFDRHHEYSMSQAEAKKSRLESLGYRLVHQTASCLTYRKPQEQQQPLDLN